MYRAKRRKSKKKIWLAISVLLIIVTTTAGIFAHSKNNKSKAAATSAVNTTVGSTTGNNMSNNMDNNTVNMPSAGTSTNTPTNAQANTSANNANNGTAPIAVGDNDGSRNTNIIDSNSTIFVGDSVTEGLFIYDFVENSTVIAYRGMAVVSAKEEMDRIAQINPKKIFILLGTNDVLSGMSSSQFTAYYVDFLQCIREKIPDVSIFVQSVLPVTAQVEADKPLLTNARIDEFNAALKAMCQEQGAKYLNIASKFKNAQGQMEETYTPDGIHINYECYKIWLDYISQNVK